MVLRMEGLLGIFLCAMALFVIASCSSEESPPGGEQDKTSSEQIEFVGMHKASGDRVYILDEEINDVFAFRDRCMELCDEDKVVALWNDNEYYICRCPALGRRYLLRMKENERMPTSEKKYRQMLQKHIEESKSGAVPAPGSSSSEKQQRDWW